MRITGVVKGTEQDAVVAANKHGLQIKVLHVLADSVTVEFYVPIPHPSQYSEIVEQKIGHWFCKSPNRPFPAGTLLLYSHHGDGPLPSEEFQQMDRIREAVANYMWSEGCSCCQNIEAHRQHKDALGNLLGIPEYPDNSGHDFQKFRTPSKD